MSTSHTWNHLCKWPNSSEIVPRCMDLQSDSLADLFFDSKESVYIAVVWRVMEKVRTRQTSTTEVFIILAHLSLQTLLAKPISWGLKAPMGHCHTPVGFSACLSIDLSILESLPIDLLSLYILWWAALLSIKGGWEDCFTITCFTAPWHSWTGSDLPSVGISAKRRYKSGFSLDVLLALQCAVLRW